MKTNGLLKNSRPQNGVLLASLFLLFLFTMNSRAADVDALLTRMTLEEKIGMLHGRADPDPALGLNGAGYVQGVPRLNIPPLRLADGPAGIRTRLPATALPAPIALAASFDADLAFRYGASIGREGLARHQNVLLSPMVNIVRVPQAGRNFETLGEDPHLAAVMVGAEIKGIQEQGLMATVKHFIANNQEDNRFAVDTTIDERTLREIYLPGFEAAVKAGVAAVMCAYNSINATFACENDALLNTVLRQEYGFKGFVMTDWWAVHSLNALTQGLNLEMPGYEIPAYSQPVYFQEPLLQAVRSGAIAESAVDQALRPILVQMERFGLLDAALPEPQMDEQAHAAVALESAIKGAVLLKNRDRALPLREEQLDKLLVLGPTASHTLVGGGGSSRVLPLRRDSSLDELRRLGGGEGLHYLPGVELDGQAIPARFLSWAGESGLLRYQGRSPADSTTAPRRDAQLVFTGEQALSGAEAWTWTGQLQVPASGSYELKIQTRGGSGRLYLDDEMLAFSDEGVLSQASLIPTRDGLRNDGASRELVAGRSYQLRVEARAQNPDAKLEIRLSWLTPEQKKAGLEQVQAQAQTASAVVVFAYVEGTEGGDRRSLALPGYQDELIETVTASARGPVIVVLNVGAPVTMPWADAADAILQMWYPGQEGGKATAALLLGHENPSGKLPVTFPHSEQDLPTPATIQYPGVGNRQQYSEGLFVGYRWYDEMHIEPLFPFGHGLSYSRFEYSDLDVESSPDQGLRVSFTLRNDSERAGVETPQLYLTQTGSQTLVLVPQKLVGFVKVPLAAGETRRLTLEVAPRAFQWWNPAHSAWETVPGPGILTIGASSRELRLSAVLDPAP
ncbi:MAG: glycoside hydrolase family 3 C-terminal domain-containing protein [Pseudomonadales bacterium]|nr:glycoside hydrolase family 3 C-terminal domain-containing protein [Pseudomonadales bacterium]